MRKFISIMFNNILSKNKKVLVVGLILGLLITSVIILGTLFRKERNNSKRYRSNYAAIVNGVGEYKTKTDKTVYFLEQENLTLREVNNSQDSIIQSLYAKFKDSGKKNKYLQQIIYVLKQANGGGVVYVTDTVYYSEGESKEGKIFTFNDSFLNFKTLYYPFNDSASTKYSYVSGLYGAMLIENDRLNWKGKKKFILWYKLGFGKKIAVIDLQSTNPNEKVIAGRNIKIYKKNSKGNKRYL